MLQGFKTLEHEIQVNFIGRITFPFMSSLILRQKAVPVSKLRKQKHFWLCTSRFRKKYC